MPRVDLFGVTEVWLDLLPASIKLPLMDATGFDVQHIITDLTTTSGERSKNLKKFSLFLALCFCLFRFNSSALLRRTIRKDVNQLCRAKSFSILDFIL